MGGGGRESEDEEWGGRKVLQGWEGRRLGGEEYGGEGERGEGRGLL